MHSVDVHLPFATKSVVQALGSSPAYDGDTGKGWRRASLDGIREASL